MTVKEKIELKDGVINIFNRFNTLDNTATIGGLRDNILRYIDSLQEEPVSEDLEEAIGEYCSNPDNFATWIGGDETDDIRLIIKAIEFGAQWKEQQLMAKAVDVEVKVDAGGYPYIPQIELYDYDKDIPLAKEGDKYKIILIKE